MHATNASPTALEPLLDIGRVTPLSEGDEALFDELHAVLKKHGALHRFGVSLLHQHFPIGDSEVLLEATDKQGRIQVTRPVDKSELIGVRQIETAWRLDTGKPISILNCVEMPDGSHQARHSDIRLKRDIRPLVGALAKVLGLTPAHYFYRSQEFKALDLPETPQLGVMAQDVAQVLPELVRGDPMEPSAYLSVDYIGLVPVLIGAIKEQNAVIENMKREFRDLQATVDDLRISLATA
jgi:hypothetical protein